MADSIAPGFLVAAPALRDPNFVRSVVVIVEHGDDGSLGFVVNRPAPVSFEQVSELLGLDMDDDIADRTPVYTGGPVAPQSGWILFDPEAVDPDVLEDAVQMLVDRIENGGLETLSPHRGHPGHLARPRALEIHAAVNRWRGLRLS